MALWKCQICNFIFEGPAPPDNCPKCGAPKEKFSQLSEQEALSVQKSRRTNYLHMKALTLLHELLAISEEIIKEDLDPPCIKLANSEKEFAQITIQKIKAELESHMKKGKWG